MSLDIVRRSNMSLFWSDEFSALYCYRFERPACVYFSSNKGWSNGKLFQQWLKEILIPSVRERTSEAVVLIVDNVSSHADLLIPNGVELVGQLNASYIWDWRLCRITDRHKNTHHSASKLGRKCAVQHTLIVCRFTIKPDKCASPLPPPPYTSILKDFHLENIARVKMAKCL